MASLVLGVIDGIHSAGEGETVAEVAAKLEAEYGIMATFWEMYRDEVTKLLMEEFARCMRTDERFTGKRTMQKVKTMFVTYLDKEEHGIKTMAAMRGVRHRNKEVEFGPPRESFIDTGEYRGSFVGWIEG